MLRPMIAVEENLSNIKDILQKEGYHVVNLSPGIINVADAVIISGVDRNIMGVHNVDTIAPVFNASGKSAEELVDSLYDYLMPNGDNKDYYFEYTLDESSYHQPIYQNRVDSNHIIPGKTGQKEIYDIGEGN